MTARLQDRVAVVIGATGGIGQAIVRRFVDEGATVVATGSSGRQNDMAKIAPGKVHPVACNVADPSSVEALFKHCRATFGRVDILVNNAGISIGSNRIHETAVEDWQRLMDINLRGVFLGMKYALPLMMEAKSGCIINMGSTSAYRGTAGTGAYGASKAGIVQLTRVAALEYVKDGIRINAVCPGTVKTSLLDRFTPEKLMPLLARIPMGRFAETDEVAALAAFLASDDAAYITGQDYILDGGRFAA